MRILVYFLLLAGLFAAGCTSSLEVTDITKAEAGDEINGLPFRLDAPYSVRVFIKDKEGSYKESFSREMILPEQDRLYALGFSSGYYSDQDLDVTFKPDGTLQKVRLVTTGKGDEAITALATEVKDVGEAVSTYRNTRDQAEIERLQKKEALREAQVADDAKQHELDQAALEALLAVEAAQRTLDGLGPDASEEERAAAAADLRAKKAAANTAYRLAGRAAPYPGVFP